MYTKNFKFSHIGVDENSHQDLVAQIDDLMSSLPHTNPVVDAYILQEASKQENLNNDPWTTAGGFNHNQNNGLGGRILQEATATQRMTSREILNNDPWTTAGDNNHNQHDGLGGNRKPRNQHDTRSGDRKSLWELVISFAKHGICAAIVVVIASRLMAL